MYKTSMQLKWAGMVNGKVNFGLGENFIEDIRDLHSIPGLGRSPGGGHGKPFWHSFLENPMDRGAWQATVHRVTKSRTQLKRLRRKAHYIFSGLHMTRSSLSLTKPPCRIE